MATTIGNNLLGATRRAAAGAMFML